MEYEEWTEEDAERLRRWIGWGGFLIAGKRAAAWATEHELMRFPLEVKLPNGGGMMAAATPADSIVPRRPYGEYEQEVGARRTPGTIFEVMLDLTHPLAYGYQRSHLAVLRDGDTVLSPGQNPYESVARYGDQPLLSGYVHPDRLKDLVGSDAVTANRVGSGLVVRTADDLNFRGIWYGTNKIFLNALFFGQVIEDRSRPEP